MFLGGWTGVMRPVKWGPQEEEEVCREEGLSSLGSLESDVKGPLGAVP